MLTRFLLQGLVGPAEQARRGAPRAEHRHDVRVAAVVGGPANGAVVGGPAIGDVARAPELGRDAQVAADGRHSVADGIEVGVGARLDGVDSGVGGRGGHELAQ